MLPKPQNFPPAAGSRWVLLFSKLFKKVGFIIFSLLRNFGQVGFIKGGAFIINRTVLVIMRIDHNL